MASGAGEMTHAEIRAVVERFVKAWTAEDLDGLCTCYDAQAEVMSPLLHTQRGIEAIERAHQDLFLSFSNVTTEVHDIIIDAEQQRAVVVLTTTTTHKRDFHGFPASGRHVSIPTAFVFHLKDGKIVTERRLYDFGGFLMQLGILKTRSV